jgi:hypothetical protein
MCFFVMLLCSSLVIACVAFSQLCMLVLTQLRSFLPYHSITAAASPRLLCVLSGSLWVLAFATLCTSTVVVLCAPVGISIGGCDVCALVGVVFAATSVGAVSFRGACFLRLVARLVVFIYPTLLYGRMLPSYVLFLVVLFCFCACFDHIGSEEMLHVTCSE